MQNGRGRIEFDWDEHNIRHLARHKVTPEEFEEAMRNPRIFIGVDDEEGEERWYALGATNALRVLVLIFTYRGEKVRPVTARPADSKRRQEYFESVREANG